MRQPTYARLLAALREAERAERRSRLDPTDTDGDRRGLRLAGALALAFALAAVALWFSFA